MLLSNIVGGFGHFCQTLHIAMQFGLYLSPILSNGVSGVQSLKILVIEAFAAVTCK